MNFSTSVLLFFVSLAAIVVARPATRSQQITFMQMSKFGSSHSFVGKDEGECTDIDDTDVPTSVEMKETGSFKLITYSTSCSAETQVEMESIHLEKSTVLNPRRAICSIQMEEPASDKSLKVTLFMGMEEGSVKILEDIRHAVCIDTCTEWTEYAKSVKIHVNGQPSTADQITLFEDNECGKQVASGVKDGADLVPLTRTQAGIVKSFTIVRDK